MISKVVAHAYNPSSQEVQAGGSEFQARLGYIMGPCVRKKGRTEEKKKKQKDK